MTTTPVTLSDILRKTLDSPVFGVVATIRASGLPHLSVVWVDRDGDDVLFAILHGSFKEKHLLADPRMTLLVNPADNPYAYASISGTVSFTHENRYVLMERLSQKYRGMTYEECFPEAGEDHDLVVVRLTPDQVYDKLS
jgi:PPOX class probable F420-dependent enzyme